MQPGTRTAFDILRPITARIISDQEKTCTVRYPTDEEWCERTRRQKMVRQNLGRGKTRPVPTRPEVVDAELFAKIRLDEAGPEFDEAEASRVIAKLDRAQVTDIERVPEGFRLVLVAGKYRTVHVLHSPSRKDVLEHERFSVSRIDSAKTQDIRIAMEPSGKLYDRIVVSTEGYANDKVPINHKFAIVYELLEQIDREEDDGEDDPEA